MRPQTLRYTLPKLIPAPRQERPRHRQEIGDEPIGWMDLAGRNVLFSSPVCTLVDAR